MPFQVSNISRFRGFVFIAKTAAKTSTLLTNLDLDQQQRIANFRVVAISRRAKVLRLALTAELLVLGYKHTFVSLDARNICLQLQLLIELQAQWSMWEIDITLFFGISASSKSLDCPYFYSVTYRVKCIVLNQFQLFTTCGRWEAEFQ